MAIQGPQTVSSEIKNLPGGRSEHNVFRLDLMVPLRAGFGTLRSRLPGGHRARSLTPLFMVMKGLIYPSIYPDTTGIPDCPSLWR